VPLAGGQARPGGVVDGQRAQGLGERQVRESDAADVETVTGQNRRTGLAGAGGELDEQTGLADSGVACDQDHAGLAPTRVVERAHQRTQLGVAADERCLEVNPGHGIHGVTQR